MAEEEYDQIMDEQDQFDHNFVRLLSDNDNFEVIQTVDNNGKPFKKEQWELIKKESRRLGINLIYKIDINPKTFILIDSKSLKIGYVSEEIH